MNCAPHDVRDYFFGELEEDARLRMDAHVTGCDACRAELRELETARAALLALRDEELPQRIAFVSDRVYEPSPVLRWWRAFWASGPRLVFAASVMLSAALVFHALRPAPEPPPVAQAPAVDLEAVKAEIRREIVQAVSSSEERHAERSAQLVSAAEQKLRQERQRDHEATNASLDYIERQLKYMHRASLDVGGMR